MIFFDKFLDLAWIAIRPDLQDSISRFLLEMDKFWSSIFC